MFFQQTFTILSQSAIPLIAPIMLPDLGAPPEYLGIFVSIAAVMKAVVNVGCGNFIRRFGGIRISQASLVFVIIGMLCAASGFIWPFLITAVCIALGTAAGTPASSHILSRYAPPRWAPVVYSAKQTSVPVSMAFGGIAIPFLSAVIGWQGTLIAMAGLCLCFGLVLQPIRAELDKDRNPHQKLSFGDFKSTLTVVFAHRGLRRLAATMFAFVGLQVTYTTYIVLFLTDRLQFSYAEAGGFFATAVTAAIPVRILWGFVASSRVGPGRVLAGLAIMMAVTSFATAAYTPDWPAWAMLAVAIGVTSTAMGWQGVLFSEIARLAPSGQVSLATGGVLGFSAVGQTILPLVFSIVLGATGSYQYGFVAVAVPSLLIGVMLMAGGVEGRGGAPAKPRNNPGAD